MRRSDRVVIFPIYIDSSKSKSDGRRVSKAKSVPNPRLSEIAEACSTLGLNFVVEENISHPTESTIRRGVVRAIKKWSKAEMLEKIALHIRRSRAEKPEKVKDK